MILYVNGDSHTAAAEAVNPYAFAEDDASLQYLGRIPHPANLAVSWAKLLSQTLKTTLRCDAESASSNARILRTTRQWLNTLTSYNELLIIIQWSTWEREEWLHDEIWYQIGASGTDHVPAELQDRYRHYVANIDWQQKTEQAHDEIWQFHNELKQKNISHLFFNGNNDFSKIQKRYDWDVNYIGPYDPDSTYDTRLRKNGIQTVSPGSWHFGKDGHSYWHRYLLKYVMEKNLI